MATALHFKAMAEGKASFYTCPIKALVNEKFFALCEAFGPENVGLMTGDATINREAPILCCTAEILANLALRDATPRADYVVMDEFHYYADRERGIAWQIPLHHPAGHHVPADVGDAGGHAPHRGAAAGAHRPRGGQRAQRAAPGAAGLRVPRDAAARDHRRT